MSVTPFTDDAYNKQLSGHTDQAGTLVGNWCEERSIREATGEGRSVPQRHIKRSGLLQDFTKTPSSGPRKQDNTFQRIYGHRQYETHLPTSKVYGAGEDEHPVRNPIAPTLQAEGRVARIGPRDASALAAMMDHAEEEVAQEDAIEAEARNARSFHTTYNVVHTKPDETLAMKAEYERKAFKKELMHGPTPDRARALQNAGLESCKATHAHYSNADAVTHPRMSSACSVARSDLKASASKGVALFGKSSDFSRQIHEYEKHPLPPTFAFDHLDGMYADLKGTNPHRTLTHTKPLSDGHVRIPTHVKGGYWKAHTALPCLTMVKDLIQSRVEAQWGPFGYIVLRQNLHDFADHEGFVSKDNVKELLRCQLGVTMDDVSEFAMNNYLGDQCTMKKDEMRICSLLSSLRPALPMATKRRLLDVYQSFGNDPSAVKLADWLAIISSTDAQGTLVKAFGGADEHAVAQVSQLPVSEWMFLEFFADLQPIGDIEAFLQ